MDADSLIPVPEAPQTIRQNWIPFLTFFFLRALSICNGVSAGIQWAEARQARVDGMDGMRAARSQVLVLGAAVPKTCWMCVECRRRSAGECAEEAAHASCWGQCGRELGGRRRDGAWCGGVVRKFGTLAASPAQCKGAR
jgi:hypothetical protein